MTEHVDEGSPLLNPFGSNNANRPKSSRLSKAKKKLVFATGLCTVFMFIELIGGYVAGSLAVMTDAAHLLSDVAGFLISLFALMVSEYPATKELSYGFHRAEILGALLSVLIIWVLTLTLIYEACLRTFAILTLSLEEPVNGEIMSIIATIGLVFNLVLLRIFYQGGHSHGHSHGLGSYNSIDDEDDHGHDHGHAHDEEEHDHGHAHAEAKKEHGDDHGHAHNKKEHEHGHAHNEKEHGHDHGHAHNEKEHEHDHGHARNEKEHGHGHAETQQEHGHAHAEEEHDHGHAHETEHGTFLKHSEPKVTKSKNLNISAAYAHALGDLCQSLGVCIAGLIIYHYPHSEYPYAQLADPLATYLFSILVVYSTKPIFEESVSILMQKVPEEVNVTVLYQGIDGLPGVVGVHHLHVWSLTSGMEHVSLSVHVQVEQESQMNVVLKMVQHFLRSQGLTHNTIQMEVVEPALCEDRNCIKPDIVHSASSESCDKYAENCAETKCHIYD